MNKRLRSILVGLFFALMLTFAAVNAYVTIRALLDSSYRGWIAKKEDNRFVVVGVDRKGPAAESLRVSDEVLELKGLTGSDTPKAEEPLWHVSPGYRYVAKVRRDGVVQEYVLHTTSFRSGGWLNTVLSSIVIPIAFLAVGLTVFLFKPDDSHALMFALMFGMVVPTQPFILETIASFPLWITAVWITGYIVTAMAFPLSFHTLLVFPEPSPLLRRFPRLPYVLYLPALVSSIPARAMGSYVAVTSPIQSLSYQFSTLAIAGYVVEMGYVLAGLLALVLNFRYGSESTRRKLGVVVAGSLVALLPTIVLRITLLAYQDLDKVHPNLWQGLLLFVFCALLLLPLSWGYAIVRHKVFPVSLIVRRGVQYLLAKNGLRVLLALPIIGLLLSIISNPNRTLADILLRNSIHFYVLLFVAVAFGLAYRKHLREWVDSRFFREHFNQEKILRELTEDVKKLDSISETSRLVSEKVDSALHPDHFYLFYREQERRDLSLGYSSGGASRDLKIPEEFRLHRFMEDQGSTQDFPFPQKNNLPQSEKDWLEELGTRLIVPMTGTDGRLAGLFLLGEKKSQVPYTARDRQLLEALADQIALVYENVRLKERVHRDRKIKHEVLARFEEQQINLLKECAVCGACFDSTLESCVKDGSELTLSLPVERIIEARYRLDQLIGRGGMGAVYAAMDTRLNRRVAVKILGGSKFGDREALRRFEREAQASARLSHPNIITTHDYGVLNTEGAYLVMELVQGETLGAKIKRERHISPQLAADWFEQVLEGVRAAHQQGIVHRDLKPENIFIAVDETESCHVRILDFGLAKLTEPQIASAGNSPSPTTTPGSIMGTFGYMSPEQLTGGIVDERSDFFSIGVMVVEALTGSRPFRGSTYHELLTNILQSSFHLRQNSPEATRLDEVLQKCLAKDRTERYVSASEMRNELIPAIRNCHASIFYLIASPGADTFIVNN